MANEQCHVVQGTEIGVVTRNYTLQFRRLHVSGASGEFFVDEEISGGTSGDTAFVTGIAADTETGAGYWFVYVKDCVDGAFTVGETITGATSGVTATVVAEALTDKVYRYFTCKRKNATWDSGSYLLNRTNFLSVAEVRSLELSYPNTALLTLEIYASKQLTRIPTINVICEKSAKTLYKWNSSTSLTEEFTGDLQNPAHAVWDILTDGFDDDGTKRGNCYGLAVHPKYLDFTSFDYWKDYCDTLVDIPEDERDDDVDHDVSRKRCVLNIVFDEKDKSVWDAIKKVSLVGRARINCIGKKYYAVVDEPGDPTQMFSSGNIVAGSLTVTFLEAENKPDSMTVEFVNEENKYEKDSVKVDCDGYDLLTSPKDDQVTVAGITLDHQARSQAKRLLAQARSLTTVITFQAEIDAIACEVGDVIVFSHNSNIRSFSGRISSAYGQRVILDRAVTLSESLYGSTKNKIYTRETNVDGSEEVLNENVIVGPFDSETSRFSLSSSYSLVPVQFDPYSIVRVLSDAYLYRVEEMEVADNGLVTITAYNYDETVYDTETDYVA